MFSFNIIVHYDNDKTNLIGTIFRSFIGSIDYAGWPLLLMAAMREAPHQILARETLETTVLADQLDR
jgi:hypothetical protein